MEAAEPTVNVLTLLSNMIKYHDDTQRSISLGHQLIEDTLMCFRHIDFVVMAAPGTMNTLHYDVAIKVIEGAPYVSFKIVFQIQP